MPVPLLVAIGEAAWWVGLGIALKTIGKWIVKQAPGWIAYILGTLGIYFAVAEPLADMGTEWIIGQFNGLPGTVAETLYYLNIDNYISAVISAYSVRAAGQLMFRKKLIAGTSGQGA